MKTISIVLLALFTVLYAQGLPSSNGKEQAVASDQRDYALPAIVIYADLSRQDMPPVPLERLATIPVNEIESLWSDLGINTKDWTPTSMPAGRSLAFPKLYAIQGYIVFEHEFQPEEIEGLRAECYEANVLVLHEEAQRAIRTIIDATTAENIQKAKLLFRPGMITPGPTLSVEASTLKD